MATYDLLMLAILVSLTIYGYFKGMAWQVAYVASFVVSYFVAVRFADRMAPQITFVNPPANKFVAMVIIYAVVSFGVWMVFRVVRKAIDSIKMEGFDHQMGAILGFGRGVLWCVGVTFLTLTVLPVPQAWKQQAVGSQSGYYIARLIDETDSIFPPEVHQVIDPYLNRLGTELDSGGVAPPSNGGWPGAASQPSAPAPAPAWGQSAGNQATGSQGAPPAWPASNNTTPTAAWPQANQPPAQPPASNFGWPSDASSTPAQPASWPDWNR
ncbi:MAG: CvpA family protein [Planctomycetota bacterium]